MSLLLPWLLFPLILVLASAGWAGLVERAAGSPLPPVLRLSFGLAVIVVVSQITVWTRFLAPFTTAIVAAGAIVGLVLLWRRGTALAERSVWAALAAFAVFAVYAAPVVLSGEATFTGYTILGDTAIHFELVDRLMSKGAAVAGMTPSSVSASLNSYFLTSYPTGAHTALGALQPLALADLAWVYQPFLAMLAANAALAFYSLARTAGVEPPLAAAVGALPLISGLVYGYALQGSIKELATVWLIGLLVAMIPWLLSEPASPRRSLPLAIVVGAALAVIDAAAAAWVLPILVALLAVLAFRARRDGWGAFAGAVGVFLLAATLLALPTLVDLLDFKQAVEGVLASQAEFGNLLRPLGFSQALGVWNAGDFRLPLTAASWAPMGQGVVVAFGVLGLVSLATRRAWAPLLLIAVSLLAWWYVARRGSPWADGKALMMLSPMLVFASLIGAAALRPLGAWHAYTVVATIAMAILATAAYAYHDVSRAPRERMDELARVNDRFAGQGPALYTDFEEFNKHFLYDLDPTGTQEAFQPFPSVVAGGHGTRFGFSADIDDFELGYVSGFPLLVLRRGPLTSRPPASYNRVFSGRWVDVWKRRGDVKVLAHQPLGGRADRGAPARCRDVMALARQARREGAQIATVRSPSLPVFDPTKSVPANWSVANDDLATLRPVGPGRSSGTVQVPRAGRYVAWIEGSFGRPVEVSVGGRRLGRVGYELSPRSTSTELGAVDLGAGPVHVSITRGGGSLRPENGGLNRLIGPVRFEPVDVQERIVERLDPDAARSLCGERLDWIEVVR